MAVALVLLFDMLTYKSRDDGFVFASCQPPQLKEFRLL